ncbi:MAG TPA: VTT domain-containing protein [Pyrinomonadaceae bacterium]|nr:VTT domain-containing protein [Pyrinomonadaceae bacterium]
MEWLTDLLQYLNPKVLIDALLEKLGAFAYVGLFLIVFAETGLAVGFFLPGDSLLVVAGLFAAAGKLNLWVLLTTLFIAAVVGDAVGYYSGKKMGKAIFNRPKSRLFNPNHLKKAHAFYEKYGGKTIIIARFVPIVRTFAPIVAGAAEMTYKNFIVYNVFGGFLWVTSMLLAGYFLGGLVEQMMQSWFGISNFKLEDHIDKVVIVVVFLSILPMIIEYLKVRREKKRELASEAEV